MPRLVWSMACGSSRFGQCVGDLVRGRRRRLASGVHDEVSCRNHPRARLPVLGEVSQAPGLCFRGALDALAQYVLIGIENDVEHREPGVAQASEYVLQVSTSKDRLRGDEVLAGEAGQFRGGSHHQSPPRWPMLEVGDWVVGEIRPQHVSHRLRIEQAARRDQRTQLSGGGGLSAAKGPVQPHDHLVMLRAPALSRSTWQRFRDLAAAGSSRSVGP
jgi:hypothetical protein